MEITDWANGDDDHDFDEYQSRAMGRFFSPKYFENIAMASLKCLMTKTDQTAFKLFQNRFLTPNQSSSEAEKPPLPRRIFFSIAIVVLHLYTWSLQLINWVFRSIVGDIQAQEKLYLSLYDLGHSSEKIPIFLANNLSHPSAAGYIFSEFLKMEELYPHMKEILNGANVRLNDQGFFLNRWKEHPKAYQRISSHKYVENQCYALDHFLFWQDLDGNTRFQFEKTPFGNFLDKISHAVDFLNYRMELRQQGVTGTSAYLEDSPLDFMICN